ncbi:hypothetical protein Agub_g13496 [Astrephomene gubernaculifera]|uniref:Methyltransferase FkbM domain-containing protein n=1 Tax=Astrephomene gubernaculifera TaxID=47775 RepID=A0AAD3HSC3_9CHLO|nr:hypothetical protein Agub_g13496 [Astrephomene gubernaculifera]
MGSKYLGPRSPLRAAVALTALVIVVLALWHRLGHRVDSSLAGVSLVTVHVPNTTDRLHTIWTVNGSSASGMQLEDKLGIADRIDVYHNVSNLPGKSTILFAYRRSSCPDWNREHPDKLFSNSVFTSVLPAGGVYVDIGACYGDTSVPLAIRADTVISFEPNPFSYKVLQLNAALNPGLDIRTHNLAAGDGRVSELTFTYGGDMCNGGVLGSWKDASTETAIKVKAVDIPSFLAKQYGKELLQRISVIKIDAEGFDSTIIRTLRPLTRHSRFVLLVEWFDYFVTSPPHGNEGPEGVHPGAKELFDAIAALGYEPFDPISGARVPGPQNKHKVPDLLCRPVGA